MGIFRTLSRWGVNFWKKFSELNIHASPTAYLTYEAQTLPDYSAEQYNTLTKLQPRMSNKSSVMSKNNFFLPNIQNHILIRPLYIAEKCPKQVERGLDESGTIFRGQNAEKQSKMVILTHFRSFLVKTNFTPDTRTPKIHFTGVLQQC